MAKDKASVKRLRNRTKDVPALLTKRCGHASKNSHCKTKREKV